jgi:hypothetical protein
MSGVWETLFAEEKQDWIGAIVNGVSCLLSLALELPCTLLALISTVLTLGYEYTCQGAHQVSDFLGLEEWWSLEHTFWLAMFLYCLPVIYKRSKGSYNMFGLTSLFTIQIMCVWGCFIWMACGLQGGVVFGGKFFFPTCALLAVTLQCIKSVLTQIEKEFAGFTVDAKVTDDKLKTLLEIFNQALKMEGTLFVFVATFGLPKLDLEADPTPWLMALPLISLLWNMPKYLDKMGAFDKTDANGIPPQVEAAAKEAAEAKPAAAEPVKMAEEPAKKVEDEKKDEEKKEEAATEPAKPSPISQAIATICGLVFSVVAFVTSGVNKVLGLVKHCHNKFTSLPWDCIINLFNVVGTCVGMTLAYWSLTEDRVIFAAPVLSLVCPWALNKMQDRNWLDASGVHMGSQLVKTASLGLQYYIFRTYISLPF